MTFNNRLQNTFSLHKMSTSLLFGVISVSWLKFLIINLIVFSAPMFHSSIALSAGIPLCQAKVSICHFTNLVEEEVIDVVSEECSELALLGLAWPHVHFYLLNEPV